MTDPAITAPVSARSNDWWRRGARTLVQFIAGGGARSSAGRSRKTASNGTT